MFYVLTYVSYIRKTNSRIRIIYESEFAVKEMALHKVLTEKLYILTRSSVYTNQGDILILRDPIASLVQIVQQKAVILTIRNNDKIVYS